MIARNVLMSIGTPAERADKWVPWLNMTMLTYEITTPQRQAMFLAQLAHESGSFRFVEENLNYSVEALQRVFKSTFRPMSLPSCTRDSQKRSRTVCMLTEWEMVMRHQVMDGSTVVGG